MPRLPTDASGLSPSWLAEALGVDVRGVEVLEERSATNQRIRIGLSFAAPGPGPTSLFVKLPPADPAHREMISASGMGRREAQFYDDVAPSVSLRVPRGYYAGYEDGGDFVLLLEDLTACGCDFSDGSWGVGADAAARALEELARFHAGFQDPASRVVQAPWLADPVVRRTEATALRLRSVLDQHGDALTDEYRTAGELYVEHHRRLNELWNAGPQTYIHGDPHIGNVFLDRGRVGFIDWGLSRVSTPLRDVSYFLTMSVEPDDRRRAEKDLLQLYLDALRGAGGAEISFNEAWGAHRVQAGYTVIATFLAFMPSYATGDGSGLGAALRRRAELALQDLEAVEAIRAAL
ncbi:MAG TPA: phosphotransferase [Acidimicrobiales bacterium]|nr:phosphotransferase [Acidimicrobiales bacterium]